MGGSIKKAFSSALKVVDPTGTVSGLVDNVTGVTAQQAAKKAAEQQQALADQQTLLQTNANALAANSAASNTATVVAGGDADTADTDSDLKKRTSRTSVSSTLGV